MNEREIDQILTRILQDSLGLSQDWEDTRWVDFMTRATRERVAWAAFAAGLARASRRIQVTLRSSTCMASHNQWRIGI